MQSERSAARARAFVGMDGYVFEALSGKVARRTSEGERMTEPLDLSMVTNSKLVGYSTTADTVELIFENGWRVIISSEGGEGYNAGSSWLTHTIEKIRP